MYEFIGPAALVAFGVLGIIGGALGQMLARRRVNTHQE